MKLNLKYFNLLMDLCLLIYYSHRTFFSNEVEFEIFQCFKGLISTNLLHSEIILLNEAEFETFQFDDGLMFSYKQNLNIQTNEIEFDTFQLFNELIFTSLLQQEKIFVNEVDFDTFKFANGFISTKS